MYMYESMQTNYTFVNYLYMNLDDLDLDVYVYEFVMI
jgi:hypothetical protein